MHLHMKHCIAAGRRRRRQPGAQKGTGGSALASQPAGKRDGGEYLKDHGSRGSLDTVAVRWAKFCRNSPRILFTTVLASPVPTKSPRMAKLTACSMNSLRVCSSGSPGLSGTALAMCPLCRPRYGVRGRSPPKRVGWQAGMTPPVRECLAAIPPPQRDNTKK